MLAAATSAPSGEIAIEITGLGLAALRLARRDRWLRSPTPLNARSIADDGEIVTGGAAKASRPAWPVGRGRTKTGDPMRSRRTARLVAAASIAGR